MAAVLADSDAGNSTDSSTAPGIPARRCDYQEVRPVRQQSGGSNSTRQVPASLADVQLDSDVTHSERARSAAPKDENQNKGKAAQNNKKERIDYWKINRDNGHWVPEPTATFSEAGDLPAAELTSDSIMNEFPMIVSDPENRRLVDYVAGKRPLNASMAGLGQLCNESLVKALLAFFPCGTFFPFQRRAMALVQNRETNVVLSGAPRSGKTFSYLIPVMAHCIRHPPTTAVLSPRFVAIYPSRTRAVQVWRDVRSLVRLADDGTVAKGCECALLVDGLGEDFVKRQLLAKPTIVVGTAGAIARAFNDDDGNMPTSALEWIAINEPDVTLTRRDRRALQHFFDACGTSVRFLLTTTDTNDWRRAMCALQCALARVDTSNFVCVLNSMQLNLRRHEYFPKNVSFLDRFKIIAHEIIRMKNEQEKLPPFTDQLLIVTEDTSEAITLFTFLKILRLPVALLVADASVMKSDDAYQDMELHKHVVALVTTMDQIRRRSFRHTAKIVVLSLSAMKVCTNDWEYLEQCGPYGNRSAPILVFATSKDDPNAVQALREVMKAAGNAIPDWIHPLCDSSTHQNADGGSASIGGAKSAGSSGDEEGRKKLSSATGASVSDSDDEDALPSSPLHVK